MNELGSARVNPVTACPRAIVPYANSLDPDETPSNSASHPDPSCLTLIQFSFGQILNESVKFKNEADQILHMRKIASDSEGVK